MKLKNIVRLVESLPAVVILLAALPFLLIGIWEAAKAQSMVNTFASASGTIITHRLSTIKDADKVDDIRDGLIIEMGTHQQLFDPRGFFYNLNMSQLKGEVI